MARIFISYSKFDAQIAYELYDLLKSRWDVWFAPFSIPPGESFGVGIGDALRIAETDTEDWPDDEIDERIDTLYNCDAVLLLLSAHSMRSPWVRRELIQAINNGKYVLALRLDYARLTSRFDVYLSDIQILEAHSLGEKVKTQLIDTLEDKVPSRGEIGHEKKHFLCQIPIELLAKGDDYYTEGETLKLTKTPLQFFLAPPLELAENTDQEFLHIHFQYESTVFSSNLASTIVELGIDGLEDLINRKRKEVMDDFICQRNGCYFNNRKYGIHRVRPFGRTEDVAERPVAEIYLYETDYYTHRVMKAVCRELIRTMGDDFLRRIDFLNLGAYRIFCTSLGLNLLLLDRDTAGVQSVLVTTRSTKAAETPSRVFSSSICEGVSISDYDPFTDSVSLRLSALRGLREELGVEEYYVKIDSLRFYSLFVNKVNLEMGVTCSVELKEEYSLQTNVINLEGKDTAIEVAHEYICSVKNLPIFLQNHEKDTLPQAIHTFAVFLNTIGIPISFRKREKVLNEVAVLSKAGTSDLCGDAVFHGNDFIAVIDGATPKGNRLWGKDSNLPADAYVSMILKQELSTVPPGASAEETITLLNYRIRKCYEEKGLDINSLPSEERLQASIAIYSVFRKEIWLFGDCHILINDTAYDNYKPVDTLLSGLRAFCVEIELAKGTLSLSTDNTDVGRDYILPYLKEQALLANTDYSFGFDVLDGGHIHTDHIVIYPVQTGDQVVLASDGYPKLFGTLKETEEYLRASIRRDKHCLYSLRGTKGVVPGNESFDDRSYISFAVE